MASIRDKLRSMNPLLRGCVYVVGGLLILLIVLQFLISFFADDYAANKLKEQVHKSSGNVYTLTFVDLDLNVLTGSASLTNLHIAADSTATGKHRSSKKPPSIFFECDIGEVEVKGVNIISTLWGNRLSINSITITEPKLSGLRNPGPDTTKSSQTFSTIDSTIYAALPSRYQSLEIDEFAIINGQGQLISTADTTASLKSLDLTLQHIQIDSASAQSGRAFITKDFSLEAQDFNIKLSDSLNIVAFNELSLSSEDQSLTLDSLEVIPRYGKLEFARKHGQKIDRIDLTIPTISVQQLNYGALIDSAKFRAAYLKVDRANIKDYLNRGIPGGPPTPKTLPFIKFRELNQPIKIDSLKIKDSFISYSEYVGDTPRAGTITFEQLNASFHNISNYSEDIQQGITTTLDAQARVMGTGLLSTHFEFPMDTQNGFHKVKGTLGSMSITDFNPMLEHVAFVRADNGHLDKLEFDMTLNETESSGTLIMRYENFQISALDQQSIKQKGLLENIKTFLANNILVKKNNNPEAGMQAGEISFKRIKHKSIFNYWWKSLLSGIKDSMKK